MDDITPIKMLKGKGMEIRAQEGMVRLKNNTKGKICNNADIVQLLKSKEKI